MTDSLFSSRSSSSNTYIDKPHFVNSVASFDVIEGDSASINLTAKANPPDIMYKWTGPDSQLDSRRFTTNGPFLNVSSVSRSDSGIFRLEASNDEGYSQTEIQLNVKCKYCLSVLISVTSNPIPLFFFPFSCHFSISFVYMHTERMFPRVLVFLVYSFLQLRGQKPYQQEGKSFVRESGNKSYSSSSSLRLNR